MTYFPSVGVSHFQSNSPIMSNPLPFDDSPDAIRCQNLVEILNILRLIRLFFVNYQSVRRTVLSDKFRSSSSFGAPFENLHLNTFDGMKHPNLHHDLRKKLSWNYRTVVTTRVVAHTRRRKQNKQQNRTSCK